MPKKISILITVLIIAIVFWVAVKPWIEGQIKFAQIDAWLFPLIMLNLLAAALGVGFILITDILSRISMSILVGIAFLIVFDFNPLYPGTFSTLILFHLYAGKLIREELNQRHKINVRAILRRGLTWVILPILIMISFAYYLDPKVQASAFQNELPPTIKQIVRQTVTLILGRELETLPPDERREAEDILAVQVIEKINELANPYFKYTPPILAFGIFIILQGLSFVFVWLGVFAGVALFWILKKIDFVKIAERDVKAEMIKV